MRRWRRASAGGREIAKGGRGEEKEKRWVLVALGCERSAMLFPVRESGKSVEHQLEYLVGSTQQKKLKNMLKSWQIL